MQGKKKCHDEIVLEALVFSYSRPDFPYFEINGIMHSAVTSGSAEVVGSRCYMRKGNRAPKLQSLLL